MSKKYGWDQVTFGVHAISMTFAHDMKLKKLAEERERRDAYRKAQKIKTETRN